MRYVGIRDPESLPSSLPSGFGAELRLDLFPKIIPSEIGEMIATSPIPLLLTLRRTPSGSERQREELIRELLYLQPEYFDLESDMDPKFLTDMMSTFPKTRFILSYHDFQETPKDLDAILTPMLSFPAFRYKIATFANSSEDAFRLLLWARTRPKTVPVPLGENGSFGRILAASMPGALSYTYLPSEPPFAGGQINLAELTKIYRIGRIDQDTRYYGLLGDPITTSIGHLYHNRVFRIEGKNSVYVKIPVSKNTLPRVWESLQEIPFSGLSITMPLKQTIFPYLDRIDKEAAIIGACNTVVFQNGTSTGYNTDGKGALDVLENKTVVRGKKIVILGAGGSARAIAFEGKKRGAEVWIVHPSEERRREVSLSLGCEASSSVPEAFDILVNTIPKPDPLLTIPRSALVMDIVYSGASSDFQKGILSKGIPIISGRHMFFRQAALQQALWKEENSIPIAGSRS